MSIKPEAYVHLSEDQTTLTFFYDAFRTYRYGTTWGIRDTNKDYFCTIPAWTGDWNSPNITVLTAVFDASFRNFRPNNTARWFHGLYLLKSIEGFEHLNTSQVTNMSGMFQDCLSLTRLDLTSFDTSQVTDMEEMFSDCSSLWALDLTSFDTSKVTDMWSMFYGCSSLMALDLTNFDTSQVADMSLMFDGCSSLTALELTSFDTSQVTDMRKMFSDCSSLRALELTSFDTSQVADMSLMFDGCSSLTALELTSFDTSQVTDMSKMFSDCSSLMALELTSFDTSQVADMSLMFDSCSSLTVLDLSSFDTSRVKVTDMSHMFRDCSSLTTIYSNSSWSCRNSNDMFLGCNSLRGATTNVGKSFDGSMANPERGYFTKKVLSQEDEAYVHLSADRKTLTFYFDRERNVRMRCYAWSIETTIRQNDQRTPEWLSSEVISKEKITQIIIDESFRNVVPKTIASWFEGLSAVTEIRGLDNLNTSEVTDMSGMFAGCSALRTLDISRFDTSHVTGMSGMFRGCKSLAELDLYFFDTAKVRDISEMFKDCKGLTALDLTRFDTSQVTDMHAMFKNCKSLTMLDLSNFQTSKVTNMGEMFSGCSTLTTILSFAFRNCFASEAMFYECSSLQGAANFNEKYTDARMANPERGYFTKKVL